MWGVSSLVGRDASIATVADLKGRRIALPFPGSPLDFQTRYLLARAGLDPDRDVEISYGAFTQSLPRLLAGQLDAAALPEPQATTAVRDQGLVRLFRYADAWAAASGRGSASPQVSLFAMADWAERAPAHARRARRGVAAGEREGRGRFRRRGRAVRRRALGRRRPARRGAGQHPLRGADLRRSTRRGSARITRRCSTFLPGEHVPLDDGFFFAP